MHSHTDNLHLTFSSVEVQWVDWQVSHMPVCHSKKTEIGVWVLLDFSPISQLSSDDGTKWSLSTHQIPEVYYVPGAWPQLPGVCRWLLWFPGGLSSKYIPGLVLVNFQEQMTPTQSGAPKLIISLKIRRFWGRNKGRQTTTTCGVRDKKAEQTKRDRVIYPVLLGNNVEGRLLFSFFLTKRVL